MKLVIQRVTQASVSVDNKVTGAIKKGFVVLLGVGKEDTDETARLYADKLCKLRIFADSEGKTNLSLTDVGGEILLISQFTLYADCQKGNRPNFLLAGSPDEANRLYELFGELCREKGINVQTGVFGAHMKVELVNQGPFTIILEGLEK